MVLLRRLLDIEDSESMDKKALSNGDVYTGSFKGTFPQGKGKYIWCDGTVYEGDWEEGKMTGKGRILWSSGAIYEGDFSGGYLHGIGTFTGLDGSEYRGAWRMNIRHGVGRKKYCNLDVYEGSWKEGIHEGCGRYSWNSGNTYIGNWKGGQMCGRGVMKWENGDVFDGFWLNGSRNGSGVYRFADGGYYFGTWSTGYKDGKGTFYPAGTKHPSLRRWCSSLGCDESGINMLSQSLSLNSEEVRVPKPNVMRSLSEKMSIGGILKDSGQFSQRTASLYKSSSLSNPAREILCREPSCLLSETSDEGQIGVQDNCTVVYEREYLQGVLKNEKVKNAEPSCKTKQRNKFHVKEAKRKSYVDILRSNRSYYLMLNLQLGIRYTVGKITPVPMREVRDSDFGDRARIRMYFPRKGSQFTPPHYSIDFYWKDYCPMVFRHTMLMALGYTMEAIKRKIKGYTMEVAFCSSSSSRILTTASPSSKPRNLREMFKLDAAEYMMSICGDDGLRELSSPGKSGSIFYLSHDDRFVIKTLKKFELKLSKIHESMPFHDVALGVLFAIVLVGLKYLNASVSSLFETHLGNGDDEENAITILVKIHLSKKCNCMELLRVIKSLKRVRLLCDSIRLIGLLDQRVSRLTCGDWIIHMALIRLDTLLKMLHKYYIHVGKHENTLITKFFGVHRITLRGGRKVRFVVMGNMFCTELRIHGRYDLKGSTVGRRTDKDKVGENTTLKDLDLACEFRMDKLLRESLFKQLSLDCKFLESQQIIDYSLLLGLHFRAPEQLRAILDPPATMLNDAGLPADVSMKSPLLDVFVNYDSFNCYGFTIMYWKTWKRFMQDGLGWSWVWPFCSLWKVLGDSEKVVQDCINSQGQFSIPPKGLILVTHEPNSVSTAPGPHIRGNPLKAYSLGEKEVDLLLPGTGRLRVQLGVNMPAQASHKLMQDKVDSTEIELFEVYDVVLYMGIIDVLQEYNLKKKVEHACKSLKYDPMSISAVEPKLYAKRFLNFLHKVFPDQP
ncbi:unnamed protein product [Dovyalis caffra]|uniref:1-phosphatidylinositol-4-phosphate 5-kinase n=1 Tax=Dovyalis caffra TaxID=77055 RepID=A0AAV1SWM2_9ROSI|nr:unnamed protein product [Dovyalis caffra]